MSENRTGKYLKYAIGEILLVVIGILIALQINNWNEQHKRKNSAKKLLKDIKISVVSNHSQLDFVIGYNNDGIASSELIKSHLLNNLPYHDSLNIHFSQAIQYSTPILNNPGYESLKSFGLNLIENDSLIQALDDFYNLGWIETLVFRQENYFYNTASPVLTNLFETVAMRTVMKPFDYDELGKSRKYLSILNTMNAYRRDQNKWYSGNLEKLDLIQEMIDDEIQ